MKISELMTTNPVTVDKDQPLTTAIDLFGKNKVSRILVTEKGKLVGVLTKRDLARELSTKRHETVHVGRLYVSSATTYNPITASPVDTVEKAVRLMTEKNIGCLPLVDGDEIAGVLTRTDLLDTCKNLETPVAEVMSEHFEILTPEDRLVHAKYRMKETGTSKFPILSKSGKLVGMLTESDIAAAFGSLRKDVEGKNMSSRVRTMLVEDVMKRGVTTIDSTATIGQTSKILLDKGVDGAPVVDGQEVIGMVTKKDIIKLLYK